MPIRPDMQAAIADVFEGRDPWAILCADCLDVMRELPAQCCAVVTDVPYQLGKKLHNDDLPWEEYLPWLDERIAECCRVGRRVFTTFASTRVIRFIRESRVPPVHLLHWHKPFLLHDRSLNGTPFIAHGEPILYWGPRSAKEGGKRGYDSFAFSSLWPRERKILGIEGPTPKPVALYLAALEFWADPGELVLDPFCGSGTTLVAAMRRGLPCIGIDSDPERAMEATARLLAEQRELSLGDVKRGQLALFRGEQ